MHGGHAVHEAVRAFVERRGAWTLAAGPLPDNVLDVLKLAARSPDKLDQWSVDLKIPPQRLAEIAASFIENVLVTPEASHYRVLGVPQDASEARITVHYHWLMKWIASGGQPPQTRARLAARFKAAYVELSDSSRRAGYDVAQREEFASRLERAPQPSQFDPRESPTATEPGAHQATTAVRITAEPADELQADVQATPEFVETIILASEDTPPREDMVDEPPARPAREPEPIRRRWTALAALLVVTLGVAVFFTRDTWLPWLRSGAPIEEAPAQSGMDQATAIVAVAPASAPVGAPKQVLPIAEKPPQDTERAAAPELSLEPLPQPVAQSAVETVVAVPASPGTPAPRERESAEPQLASLAEEQSPDLLAAVVPVEARTAARRVADAYAAGDVLAALNLVNQDGSLSQPELASIAADVRRWSALHPGEPLAITATRVLPPAPPGEGERAAVELRARDDAGLRVILAREGATWRARDVLVIAPTASRDRGDR